MRTDELTDRQREIKTRLDQGMGAREIAEDLGITRNAVYQQIQRLRRYGVLESSFTPTGAPRREQASPGADALRELLSNGNHDETHVAGTMALVSELRRTRDELAAIQRRISEIIPQ
jgi:predicted ArsR family transcriptional regulator